MFKDREILGVMGLERKKEIGGWEFKERKGLGFRGLERERLEVRG